MRPDRTPEAVRFLTSVSALANLGPDYIFARQEIQFDAEPETEAMNGMNRRKLLSLLGAAPALLSGTSTAADAQQSKPVASRAASSGQSKFEALNPKGAPPPIQLLPMAPRLGSLDGKTVYLVDTGFEGGGMLLNQIQLWFNRNMPAVTVVFKRKAGPYAEDDPALWKEIKEKGNAAIMAIGH
jgi:hypothetical protein